MKPKDKPKDRVLPTVFRGGIIKTEWFRKFTLRERLLLILGHNFVVYIGVACQYNVGQYQPMIIGKCSKHAKADEVVRENIELLLAEQRGKGNEQPL